MLPCGPAGRGQGPQGLEGTAFECRLEGKTKLSSRDMKSPGGSWSGGVLPLAIITAAGLSSQALRSSAASLSTLARISSVGNTQSIGMELHRSVGQLSR